MDRARTCAENFPGVIHCESVLPPPWEDDGARQLSARCSRLRPQGLLYSPQASRLRAYSRRRLRSRSRKAPQTVRFARDPRRDFHGLMSSCLISFPYVSCRLRLMARTGSGLTNRNLLWLCFRGLWQRDGKDPIPIGRTDFLCIHAGWERNASTEFADITLGAFCFLPVRSLTLSLAADCQRPVVQGNFDIFSAHSGQLDHGHDVVAVLVEIKSGRPSAKKLSW